MITLRIVYTKEGYMAFLGHLEMMKLFERVFRFNKVPLKFSEGFNPIPRMTFAAPLSVGYSSKYEVMEVLLEKEIPMETVKNIQFPEGISVIDAAYVESKKSLMAALTHAEYLIKVEFNSNIERLPVSEWIDAFTQNKEIVYEKKAKNGKMKQVNINEQIDSFKMVFQSEQEILFRATLQSGSQGSLNPETLVKVLFETYKVPQTIETIRVERIGLFFENDGVKQSIFNLSE
ncbi:MAG: hypothetical protein BGO41_12900 [Clostridiales bacterium 38-18]|nr:MAG: hypothetical protein BGO41_12900 [Clostridiales bacterium 38-18]